MRSNQKIPISERCLEAVRLEEIEQEQTTTQTVLRNERGVHVAWPKKVTYVKDNGRIRQNTKTQVKVLT